MVIFRNLLFDYRPCKGGYKVYLARGGGYKVYLVRGLQGIPCRGVTESNFEKSNFTKHEKMPCAKSNLKIDSFFPD